MKKVVGGFKMLTQDFYGNSKAILVAGIVILAITSSNRNLKSLNISKLLAVFF
jgi:hypothetical protein